jgi:hypothetical protein
VVVNIGSPNSIVSPRLDEKAMSLLSGLTLTEPILEKDFSSGK